MANPPGLPGPKSITDDAQGGTAECAETTDLTCGSTDSAQGGTAVMRAEAGPTGLAPGDGGMNSAQGGAAGAATTPGGTKKRRRKQKKATQNQRQKKRREAQR